MASILKKLLDLFLKVDKFPKKLLDLFWKVDKFSKNIMDSRLGIDNFSRIIMDSSLGIDSFGAWGGAFSIPTTFLLAAPGFLDPPTALIAIGKFVGARSLSTCRSLSLSSNALEGRS